MVRFAVMGLVALALASGCASVSNDVAMDFGPECLPGASQSPAGLPAGLPALTLPAGIRVVPAKPKVASEEPLRAELQAFIAAVRNRTQPVVTLADGRRALNVALEILHQIEDHAARANLAALVKPR